MNYDFDQLVNRLNLLLKNKNSFYLECCWNDYDENYFLYLNRVQNINKLTPSRVILKLNELGFNFTDEHLINF